MEKIEFDYSKLNAADRRVYDAMTGYERQNYERTWVQLETQKVRLIQYKNSSRLRVARDKKALEKRERRERTHRLIERGAILESFIKDPEDLTNEQIIQILKKSMTTDFMLSFVESIRHQKQALPEISVSFGDSNMGAKN